MSDVITKRCDQCGAIKGQSNHWLHLHVFIGENKSLIHIGYDEHDLFEQRDLCGQACFHKHLDALLFPEKKAEVVWEIRAASGDSVNAGRYEDHAAVQALNDPVD